MQGKKTKYPAMIATKAKRGRGRKKLEIAGGGLYHGGDARLLCGRIARFLSGNGVNPTSTSEGKTNKRKKRGSTIAHSTPPVCARGRLKIVSLHSLGQGLDGNRYRSTTGRRRGCSPDCQYGVGRRL